MTIVLQHDLFFEVVLLSLQPHELFASFFLIQYSILIPTHILFWVSSFAYTGRPRASLYLGDFAVLETVDRLLV